MTQTTLPLEATAAPNHPIKQPQAAPLPSTAASIARPLGKIVFIDPASVKPDGVNPRDFAQLDEKACGELIEMIDAVGQQSAVLVRPLPDDPSHEFQLVAGARRLWSVL